MANYLALGYSDPHPDASRPDAKVWRLPVTSDPEAVREQLANADPDRFVPVQVVFQDQLHEQTLYVQLRRWGTWMIHDADEPDSSGR